MALRLNCQYKDKMGVFKSSGTDEIYPHSRHLRELKIIYLYKIELLLKILSFQMLHLYLKKATNMTQQSVKFNL